MLSNCLTHVTSAAAVSASAASVRSLLRRSNASHSHSHSQQPHSLTHPQPLRCSSPSPAAPLLFSCANTHSLLSSSFHSSSSSSPLASASGCAQITRWRPVCIRSSPSALCPSDMRRLLSLLADSNFQRFFSTSTTVNPSSSTSTPPSQTANNSKVSDSDSSSTESASGKSSEQDEYAQAAQEEADYQASHGTEKPRSTMEKLGRFVIWCVGLVGGGYLVYLGTMYSVPWFISWRAQRPEKFGFMSMMLLTRAVGFDEWRPSLIENENCLNAILSLLQVHVPIAGLEFSVSDIAAHTVCQLATHENTRDALIEKVDDLLSYLFAVAYSGARLGAPNALLAIKLLLASKHPKILKELEEKNGLLLLMRLGRRPNDMIANVAMECVLTAFDNRLISDLRPLFNAYPQDREAIIFAAANVGMLYLERKQYDLAAYALGEALKLAEKNSNIRTSYGQALWERGERLHDEKMKEEAIRQYRLALKNDPTVQEAAYRLSRALLEQAGINLSSESSEYVQENKARTKEEEAKIDSAFKEVIQLLQQTLAIAKEVAKEFEIHEQVKQAPGGINLAPAPMGMHPLQHPSMPGICSLLVRAYEHSGRIRDAMKVASDWAIHFHHQPAPHFILGRLALESGDSELALRELRKAYELDPERPEIAYKYALALYKANRLDDAQEKALEALRNNRKYLYRAAHMDSEKSDSPSKSAVSEWRPLKLPRLLLARIYIRQNKFSEALSQLTRYLESVPQSGEKDILAEFLRAICIQQTSGLEKACPFFEQTMNIIENKVDKKNGGKGFNHYVKQNPKVAKKLSSIEDACKKATNKDKEEQTPFGRMCKQYERLKLLR